MEDVSYVYMVKCEDGSYYTGITKDVKKRMEQHYRKKKQGAKYTKSRQVVSLEMVWETDSWSLAGKMEYFIKTLTKKEKENMIRNPLQLAEMYQKRKEREAPKLTVSKELGEFPVFLEKWF